MALIYDDEQNRGGGNFSGLPATVQASQQYLKHYDNLLFLTFILENSDNRVEKHQARKELGICERKLAWWKHQWNYDQDIVTAGIIELKKKWSSKRSKTPLTNSKT